RPLRRPHAHMPIPRCGRVRRQNPAAAKERPSRMSAKISAHYPYRSLRAKEEYLEFLDRLAKDWPIPSESRLCPPSFGQTFVADRRTVRWTATGSIARPEHNLAILGAEHRSLVEGLPNLCVGHTWRPGAERLHQTHS